jgi:hypothetical protein
MRFCRTGADGLTMGLAVAGRNKYACCCQERYPLQIDETKRKLPSLPECSSRNFLTARGDYGGRQQIGRWLPLQVSR